MAPFDLTVTSASAVPNDRRISRSTASAAPRRLPGAQRLGIIVGSSLLLWGIMISAAVAIF